MMVAVVLAQMWDRDDHMGGGWWWVMGIGWLLFLAFIGFMAYLLVRHLTEARGELPGRSPAEDLLAERLARGEIDEEEYRRRRDALRG
jgi:putative membrane protein